MEADMRRAGSLVTLTTAALVGLGALGSPASASYGDNFVQVQATQRHQTVERSNLMVVANDTDTVDNGNLAEAYAHDCTGCRAVAVAFQVVIIPGSPHTVTPGNLASASTLKCSNCTAIAIAKQYVVYSHGADELTESAQRQVADIRRQVNKIATSGASAPDMESQLEPLYQRLMYVVDHGLAQDEQVQSSERSRAA
jgi:putative peptide zinc metalloprotease protein